MLAKSGWGEGLGGGEELKGGARDLDVSMENEVEQLKILVRDLFSKVKVSKAVIFTGPFRLLPTTFTIGPLCPGV